MKRIAIFCDGTWNSPTLAVPTNVVRLSDSCIQDNDQHVIYLQGVGVNAFDQFVKRWVNKLGGGAFGWGLAANVKRAYKELCQVYEDGDEIYIFGFSRGAYTARSLAGMIRKCGIVPRDKLNRPLLLGRAWRLYKESGKGKRPDDYIIWKRRSELSPDFATSEADWKMREGKGSIVRVTYLGVWDTVGALGVPESLLGPVARFWNRKYKFHDTDLSSMVKNARHAVAIDEQRKLFEPALWGNLTGPSGLNRDDQSEDRPYQQLWFVGTHGIIGGSSATRPLVAFPLAWITEGATQIGLRLKPDAKVPDMPGDPIVITPEIELDDGMLKAWRRGLDDPICCHWSVGERARRMRDTYAPGTLQSVRSALLSGTARPEVLHA